MKVRKALTLMLAILMVLSATALAGCDGKDSSEGIEGTDSADVTGTPLPEGEASTDASGTVEIDTAPADAAEQTADEWLKANGKEGYAVMARVMYPDRVEVMYTKAGEPNITLLVDAETGKVTGTK